jgi:hypothetical protein
MKMLVLLILLGGVAAAKETKVQDPALRKEILALVDEDQAVRNDLIKKGFKDQKALERMRAVDKKSTARMKEIVAKLGWPGNRLLGEEGAHAAWLLVQHAEPAFQKECLAKMERAVKAGDASAKDWAYLLDRVAVDEGRKQTYGTQFDEHMQPAPIEDEAHVDERRKSVGLGTMAEYKKDMEEMYGPPKK